jgi:hypothetical protein
VWLPDGTCSTVRVVAAGGFPLSVASLLVHGMVSKCEDVDLYIVGAKDDATFAHAVADLATQVLEHGRALSDHRQAQGVTLALQAMTIITRGDIEHVQISQRRFDNEAEIGLSFDLPAACFVLSDMHTLIGSECAVHALSHMSMTIDPWQHTRCMRLRKYSTSKGFRIVVPVNDSTRYGQIRDMLIADDTVVVKVLEDARWNVTQIIAMQVHPYIDIDKPDDSETSLTVAGLHNEMVSGDSFDVGRMAIARYAHGKKLVVECSTKDAFTDSTPRILSALAEATRFKPFSREMYTDGGTGCHFYTPSGRVMDMLVDHLTANDPRNDPRKDLASWLVDKLWLARR